MCAGQVVSEVEVPPHGPPDGEAVNVAVNFWYQSNPFDTGCWPLSYTSYPGVNGVAFAAQPPRPASSAVAVGAARPRRGVHAARVSRPRGGIRAGVRRQCSARTCRLGVVCAASVDQLARTGF